MNNRVRAIRARVQPDYSYCRFFVYMHFGGTNMIYELTDTTAPHKSIFCPQYVSADVAYVVI